MKKILTLLVLTLSFGNVHAQNTNKLKKESLGSPMSFEAPIELLRFSERFSVPLNIFLILKFVPKEIQLIIHNISKLPKKIKGYSYNLNKNNNS